MVVILLVKRKMVSNGKKVYPYVHTTYFVTYLFTHSLGPNSFQPSPTILRFAKDINKLDELVLADPTLPRFVYWDGQLNALPGSIPDVVINFNLLDWPAKIRAGLGAIGLIAPRPESEESIREFVTRHLGAQVELNYSLLLTYFLTY